MSPCPQGSDAVRRMTLKVEELQPLAQRLGCSVPQLAIGGDTGPGGGREGGRVWGRGDMRFVSPPPPPAWCLRAEGVSSVLLGAASPELLREQLRALQVRYGGKGRTEPMPPPLINCPLINQLTPPPPQVLPLLSPPTLQDLQAVLGDA